MGQRFWAMWAKRTALSVVVAFLFGMALKWLTSSEHNQGDYGSSGLVTVAVYVTAGIGLLIINSCSGLLYFWLDKGTDFTQTVLENLRKSRIPPPREFDAKTTDYLQAIADDEDEPANERVLCAVFHTTLQAAYQRAGFFSGMVLAEAANRAVLRFAEESPQRRKVP